MATSAALKIVDFVRERSPRDPNQTLSPEWILIRAKNMIVHGAGPDPQLMNQVEAELRGYEIFEFPRGGLALVYQLNPTGAPLVSEVLEAWQVHDPLGRTPAAMAEALFVQAALFQIEQIRIEAQNNRDSTQEHESIAGQSSDIYPRREGGGDQLTTDDIKLRDLVAETLFKLPESEREEFRRKIRDAVAEATSRPVGASSAPEPNAPPRDVDEGPGPPALNQSGFIDTATSGNPIDFLKDHFREQLAAGTYFLEDLRKQEPKLTQAIYYHCRKFKVPPETALPPSKKARPGSVAPEEMVRRMRERSRLGMQKLKAKRVAI